ncbi:MAG: hypothetical protein CME62_11385 [Halobacteriovoraceae bacterium]|nr:hypothetical protein [Halobacteriovoraceae bacterium]|tara:strand:+ start:25787 stop:26146 length:360 start_codon:yes stop_codon:yes gene_type:complete
MSFSQTLIIGHLGANPEMKYTKSSKAILTFSVGVAEYLPPSAPKDQKPKTHWHKCRVWDKRAETLQPQLKKGDKVFVKGTLVYDTWQDKANNWHKDALIDVHYLEKMYFENISIDLDSF